MFTTPTKTSPSSKQWLDDHWDFVLEQVGFHEAHRARIRANLNQNGIMTPARLKVSMNMYGSDSVAQRIDIIHKVISFGIPVCMREDDRVWHSRLIELNKILPLPADIGQEDWCYKLK